MRKDQTTMKVWPQTAEKLRAIAAATGVPMVRLLDKWADRELARLESGNVKTATAKLGGIVRGIVVGPVAATMTAHKE